MKRVLCFIITVLTANLAVCQNISTTYSYTWKYDTTFNTQVGTQDFAYTGAAQTFNASAGTYTLEVWGAQGGYYGSNTGGYGGYSTGIITLPSPTTLYVLCGGCPGYSYAPGFNGGGTGSTSSGAGGGGGSDIRVGSNSLYARVIVAGGGGASGYNHGSGEQGGYGGGTTGGTGTCASYTDPNNFGHGGTQTSGGINTTTWTGTFTNASFGQGASNTYTYYGFGGGGGWYGGGAGQYEPPGGGSGYVYTSSTASYYPAGCLLNSSYYLTSASTYAGNTSFPSTSGGYEYGHQGNGYARIKYNFKVIDNVDSTISHIYVTTTITDEVCKNGIYTKFGFYVDGNTLSSGVHTFTHNNQSTNKDSTTILYITIKPDANTYIEIDAPYSYTWPLNGVTYTESGVYTDMAVTADGCDSNVVLALTIYDPTVGIDDNNNTTTITITPNPAKDYIEVDNKNEADVTFAIYDIYGKVCDIQKVKAGKTRISVSTLPAGIYFLQFDNNGYRLKTEKLIIMK